MRKIGFVVLAALVLAVSSAAESRAGKRIALVVGNSAYTHIPALPNPTNDATAIAGQLREAGFDHVELNVNLDYSGLRRALGNFASRSIGADIALIFFAGHGIELGGDNFLIPIDARLRRGVALEYEAVKLKSVIRAVRAANSLGLVILDACRNSPTFSNIRIASGIKRSVKRGFRRVEPKGDVLVAYAAEAGTTADDGSGIHSPYTTALLRHLTVPGLEVRLLFGKVRDEVRAATSRIQEPAYYGSLGGDPIFLVPQDGGTTPKASIRHPLSEAALAWSAIEDTTSPAVIEAYIKEFPDTVFAKFAQSRLREIQNRSVTERLNLDQFQTVSKNKMADRLPVAATSKPKMNGEYVVQLGGRRSQTAALAGFADLQQKYPEILSGYRPLIQKADLGNKGIWYRLRIGPLVTKTAAANLCKKLKAAGMRSCLVNSR